MGPPEGKGELAVALAETNRGLDAMEAQGPLNRASSGGASSSARQPALAGQFTHEHVEEEPLPWPLDIIRKHLFKGFLVITFAGSFIFLLITFFTLKPQDDEIFNVPCNNHWKEYLKYLSIPLVSIVFTWWHVWLGIKMCFYPVEFVGCCFPVCGWQGIVPRRAAVMAERSCDIMLGTLITVEEIIDRVEPQDFFSSLETVFKTTSAVVLSRVAKQFWPNIWEKLPDSVKEELRNKVMEESQKTFDPVIADLKQNVNNIIDIKQMAIEVLVDNKPLLVEMFQRIGAREFTFIQHVAAVMGFILGIIQMLLWLALNSGGGECKQGDASFRCWGGFVILPVSGLIIGFFTNWLGITMIFRPVNPTPLFCGKCGPKIQGVFLRRQYQVSEDLAKVICKELVNARKMLEYVVKKEDVMDKILLIYQNHFNAATDQVLGKANRILPLFVGKDAVRGVKEKVIEETLAELPNHSREIEEYMDRAFSLSETITWRLQHLPPEKFEGMLHPVFQEDEWMVLLLGGVLGVVVGSLQAVALGN